MPNSVFALQVSPSIPSPLQRLDDLAKNFWFSWNPALGQLFRKLDPVLWRKVEGSPRLFLRSVDQSILDRAATDAAFIDEYRKIVATFDEYLGSRASPPEGLEPDDLIAYFCAEYGWHESFPIYSGGLGVLAGDHCKTASDLGLPFVAVGLLYRQGYFHQSIDRNGQQVPDYPPIDPRSAPLSIALHPDGSEVRVTCPALDRNVAVRVWKAPVGRVTVLLLDTDVPENVAEDRLITGMLYGGGPEVRQLQETVLGIGGVRALRALELQPTVWHINEGHAAFLVIERMREYTTAGVPFSAALEATAASMVFTTHTPVSAGHDVFPPERVARQFAGIITELGITAEQLLDLGRAPEQLRCVQHDPASVARLGRRQRRQQDPWRGVVALVRERLARRAARRESRRLRDERRARLDVPAAHLGEAVRSALGRRLASSHDGPRVAWRASTRSPTSCSGRPARRSRARCCASCGSA